MCVDSARECPFYVTDVSQTVCHAREYCITARLQELTKLGTIWGHIIVQLEVTEILLYEIRLEWNPRLFLIWDFSSSLSRASYEGILCMLECRKAVGRQRKQWTKSENLYEMSFQMCLIISGKEKTKKQPKKPHYSSLCNMVLSFI